jgi:3-oxoacyl-[acyl-carrier-protein] synthase II
VDVLQAYGPRRVKPLMFPSVLNNMGSAQVAMKFGMRGANFSVSAACATSAVAIGEAVEMVRRGEVDVMLGGGSEAAFAMFAMAGLNATRALTNRNDAPELASRPFDATRDGYVPAEGAGMLVIETLEHAQARGAKVLAEVVGYGVTCDAHHVTAPEETGAAIVHAIKKAISRAGITIYDIDYINAHGTSTPLNDLSETRAIKQVFGEQAYNIPVSSTKSMTGHAMSAAGVFEAIFSIKAMHEGVIPPTINYHNPDPACDLDYVPNVARKADKPLRYVMSNSFGFGGQNAVLIFKNPALDPTLNGANGAHS